MRLLAKNELLAQIGIFLLGFCGSLYVALTPANSMMNWYSVDDAFYYYKVAQNVVSGYGFTFDQINLTNGFHPLWMLVCMGVFWLTRINLLLPLRVLILVSGVLNGLTGVLLFRFLKGRLHPAAALLGPLVWVLLPRIFNTSTVHGMETTVSVFFMVLFVSRSSVFIFSQDSPPVEKKQILILGLLGALTILSRLDNLFVVAVVGVFIIFKLQRINRLLIFDMTAILLATVFAWLIRFGTSGTVTTRYSMYPIFLLGLFIKPIILFFWGFYNPSIKSSLTKFIMKVIFSFVVIVFLEYLILWALQQAGIHLLLSRSVILLDVALFTSCVSLIRFFYHPSINQKSITPWQQFLRWLKSGLTPALINGVTFVAPVAVLIGTYMLINKFTLGTFTPVSGQIKVWWGSLGNTVYSTTPSLVEMLGLSPNQSNGPWSLLTAQVSDMVVFIRNLFTQDTARLPTGFFLIVIFLIFLLFIFLLSRKQGYLAKKSFLLLIPALTIGCFLHITYYAAVGYAQPRPWYWGAQMLTIVLLGSVFISRLFEKIKDWTGKEILNQVVVSLSVLVLLIIHTRFVINLSPNSVTPVREADYIQSMRELEKYTNEGSLIGMTGGGNVAYFIEQRTIVNMDGLINSPQYFSAIKAGKGAQFLNELGLDYVYGNSYMLLETEPYDAMFLKRVDKIGYIHGPDNFVLYHYIPNQ